MLDRVWHLCKTGGWPMAARLSRWRALAHHIIDRAQALKSSSDDELRELGLALGWRARAGTPLSQLMPQTYALIREFTRREMGIEQYLVQVIGAIALFEGGLAEMQTGEGKTLTGVFPACLFALRGKGSHVVTVNDYLAERDADELSPIYHRMGLSVGVIQAESTPEERQRAYACDLTYGTSREYGFDFLRDRLHQDGETEETHPRVFRKEARRDGVVQRGLYFGLIDEADSVLIDDAGTPLVIGVELPPTESSVGQLKWCREMVGHLRPHEDYILTRDKRQVELTIDGCRRLMMWPKPAACNGLDSEKLYRKVENALRGELLYQQDRDYVIVDGEVQIVDESTGRTLPGRKWQEGMHQAIECKAGVEVTADTGEAARITVQTFFRRYKFLAGMTGTGITAASEFHKTYRTSVTRIPTHRRCIRKSLPTRIFVTLESKWEAVADQTESLRTQGRSVLIGTPSVGASERLSEVLTRKQIPFQILNARFHEEEAAIVAQAGQPGRVTIATNMAGRGTDIKLHPDVHKAGGLHVIVTEVHSSLRIDRQLIGRCARQGDPGSYQFMLSLEDELFRATTPARHQRWLAAGLATGKKELSRRWLGVFRKTQNELERRSRKNRKSMLKEEAQREKVALRQGLDPYLELVP
ncbi:MAG: translocase [Planctomycetaceae bacterium]|nr:translocase [Planctomycetaceae bacterium]